MAITLELYDGSTTINFVGSTNYKADISSLRFGAPARRTTLAGITLRGVEYLPRELSFNLRIVGSSASDMKTKVRDLENMVAVAEQRQQNGQGTIVVLKAQVGNTNADDIDYRILTGELALSATVLDDLMISQFTEFGTLTLLTEPFGRLAAVTVAQATLENHQISGENNYQDIQNITGTHGAKLQYKIAEDVAGGNAWSGTERMWIAKRSGERRTDDLFFQGEEEQSIVGVTNPVDVNNAYSSDGALADATGSDNVVLRMALRSTGNGTAVQTFTLVAYAQYAITGGNIPDGLFRVIVRVRARESGTSTVTVADMGFALGWEFGGTTKVPVAGEEVVTESFDQWDTFDLGELALPPANTPDGFTPATFNLRIYATYFDAAYPNVFSSADYLHWDIDYIFLLPIDEGALVVSSVAPAAEKVLLDSLSDTPGAYILNASDVVQKFATITGGPFDIGPEDTRIFVLRDDVGAPDTAATFAVDAVHTPLVVDI